MSVIPEGTIGTRFISVGMALLLFMSCGCSGGEKTVPTVDVPKGGKDTTSRDISNPLETNPEARPVAGGKRNLIQAINQ